MAGLLSRRGFLAGLGGGSALAALGAGGLAAPASAQAFNWKKHAGTKLRVVTLKFPLSEIRQVSGSKHVTPCGLASAGTPETAMAAGSGRPAFGVG